MNDYPPSPHALDLLVALLIMLAVCVLLGVLSGCRQPVYDTVPVIAGQQGETGWRQSTVQPHRVKHKGAAFYARPRSTRFSPRRLGRR